MLAPSVLSADFARLAEDIKKIEKGGADYIHLDIMDGHFVPNISYGLPVVSAIKKVTDLPLDAHLMIEDPDRYIEDFVKAGADIITVHQESTRHLDRTIQLIKSFGAKAAVALNPATPLNTLEYVLDSLDMVLIMSVNPGFGGQSFIEESKRKIVNLRKMIDERDLKTIIQVDGGVKKENAKELKEIGVDMIVVGSGIFGADDIIEATRYFKNI